MATPASTRRLPSASESSTSSSETTGVQEDDITLVTIERAGEGTRGASMVLARRHDDVGDRRLEIGRDQVTGFPRGPTDDITDRRSSRPGGCCARDAALCIELQPGRNFGGRTLLPCLCALGAAGTVRKAFASAVSARLRSPNKSAPYARNGSSLPPCSSTS